MVDFIISLCLACCREKRTGKRLFFFLFLFIFFVVIILCSSLFPVDFVCVSAELINWKSILRKLVGVCVCVCLSIICFSANAMGLASINICIVYSCSFSVFSFSQFSYLIWTLTARTEVVVFFIFKNDVSRNWRKKPTMTNKIVYLHLWTWK